jgi:transcription initiation factor IIE alpha subunit
MKNPPKKVVAKRAAPRSAAAKHKKNVGSDKISKLKKNKLSDEAIVAEAAGLRKAAVSASLETLLNNENAMNYIRQNVSRKAEEVLCLLTEPRTDEQISALLDLKINTVRRILNILQGYGVTNYTTAKDEKGWLSFFWSINPNKIGLFFDYINTNGRDVSVITDSCNDYFICSDCYVENCLIFSFEAAYEAGFRCTCKSKLERIDRTEAERLIAADNKKETSRITEP